MKHPNPSKTTALLVLVALWILTAGSDEGLCKLVTMKEAVAAADLWYAMEINSEHLKMEPAERAERIKNIRKREVLYLVSADELRNAPPKEGEGIVLAYIVKYKPDGFVVVSGEDRIDPVLTFNAQGTFRFDQPERNFMRHYLATALIGRWDALRKTIAGKQETPVHAGWSMLRSRLARKSSLENVTFGTGRDGRDIYILLDTPLWDQGWPYNESVVAHNGNISGIPTGCTATAMAIQMRFHEWPPVGNGSHSYMDSKGSVQFPHSVNYGGATYDWSAMPYGNVTQSNAHVAALIYHCGVAVEMDYEVGESGAWPSHVATNIHCLYWGTFEALSLHDVLAADSILGRLPVVMSTNPHTVVACGYRDSPSPHFYINVGYNGSLNGWYNLDAIPGGGLHPVMRSYPYSSPYIYRYVDWSAGPGQIGTLQYPFTTFAQGYTAVPAGGKVWLREGTYPGNSPLVLNKKMTLRSYRGTATIK